MFRPRVGHCGRLGATVGLEVELVGMLGFEFHCWGKGLGLQWERKLG